MWYCMQCVVHLSVVCVHPRWSKASNVRQICFSRRIECAYVISIECDVISFKYRWLVNERTRQKLETLLWLRGNLLVTPYTPFRLIQIEHNNSCEHKANKQTIRRPQDGDVTHKNTARTLRMFVVLPVGYTSHNSSSRWFFSTTTHSPLFLRLFVMFLVSFSITFCDCVRMLLFAFPVCRHNIICQLHWRVVASEQHEKRLSAEIMN